MTTLIENNDSLDQIRKKAFEALDEGLRVKSKLPIRSYFSTITNYNQEIFKLQSFIEGLYDAVYAVTFQSPNRNIDQKLRDLLNAYVQDLLPEENEKFNRYHDQYVDRIPSKDSSYSTKFQIGPLEFTHSVQSVRIAEQKAVQEFATSRKQGSFIIPSGEARPVITIDFTFSGLEQINFALRPLIALFRTCPITVVNDIIVSSSLGNTQRTPRLTTVIRNRIREIKDTDNSDSYKINETRDNSNRSELQTFLEKYNNEGVTENEIISQAGQIAGRITGLLGLPGIGSKIEDDSVSYKDTEARLLQLMEENEEDKRKDTTEGFIPVALKDLIIGTHPDLPETFNVTLTMVRITTDAYAERGVLWKNERGEGVIDPKRAFYLKRAINKYLERIPEITATDFTENSLERPVSFIAEIERLQSVERVRLDFSEEKYNSSALRGDPSSPYRMVHIKGMHASISHHYSFPVLIGKEYPTAQHVGTTNINYGLNICTESEELIKDLNAFKKRIDGILRSEFYEERVYGVQVQSPLTTLLQGQVFHFLQLNTSTDQDSPRLVHIDISMAENRLDFINDQIVTIRQGSYNAGDIKDFWDRVWELAIDGLENIFAGQSPQSESDVIKIFSEGMNKLRDSVENDNSDIESFLQWKSILMLYGIPGNVELQGIARGSIGFNVNSRSGSDAENSRYGLLTSTLFIDALTNPHTSFEESKDFRDIYLDLYAEIYDPLTGSSTLGQFLKSLYLRFQTRTSLGRLSRDLGATPSFLNALRNEDNNINEMIARLDDIILDRAGVPQNENFDDSYERIAKTILFLSDDALFSSNLLSDLYGLPFFLGTYGIYPKQEFRDALFNALYYRPSPWNSLAPIIDQNTKNISRSMLIREFEDNWEVYFKKKDLSRYKPRKKDYTIIDQSLNQYANVIKNNYQDFDLPSYYDMFGNAWPLFAPTYDEVGQQAPISKRNPLSDSPEAIEEDIQYLTFAEANDPVPPSIFFYEKRAKDKDQLRNYLHDFSKIDTQRNEEFYTGLDFDLMDISDGRIKDVKSSTLSAIISNRLSSSDSQARRQAAQLNMSVSSLFRESNLTPEQIRKIVELSFEKRVTDQDFQDALFGNDGFIKKYIYTKDGRKQRTGLMYGVNYGDQELPEYKRATEAISATFIRTAIKRWPKEDAYKLFSALDGSYEYGLSKMSSDKEVMKDYRKFTIDKMVNGLNDLRFSPIRAYPAFRFYLLDDDEKKFIYYDIFSGITSVQSIHITSDKYDPPVAQITIADPLRIIQRQYFDNLEENDPILIDPKRRQKEISKDPKTKIKIGRPIQIRMGYSSNPDGLDIVFNGRITEIVPGDIITLVAQGWKAELMAHEVQLKLNQGTKWFQSSVRDLVASAIRESDIEGFGAVYTPQDSEILGSMGFLQKNTAYSHSESIANGSPADYLELFATSDVVGIDTRLKNIWVPDSSNRISYFLTHPQAWTKEWIVPMQPLWDVLQEASRHAMGHICEVVPYDGRATVFFGTPDQPYFYTEIDPRELSKWRKYANKTQREAFDVLQRELFIPFFDSGEFNSAFLTAIKRPPRPLGRAGLGGEVQSRIGLVESNLINGPMYLINRYKKYKSFGESYNRDIEYIFFTEKPSYRGALAVLSKNPARFTDLPDAVDFFGTVADADGDLPTNVTLVEKDDNLRLSKVRSGRIDSNNPLYSLANYSALEDLEYIRSTTFPNIMDIILALTINSTPEDISVNFSGSEAFYQAILNSWINENGSVNIDEFLENISRISQRDLESNITAIGAGTAVETQALITEIGRAKDRITELQAQIDRISDFSPYDQLGDAELQEIEELKSRVRDLERRLRFSSDAQQAGIDPALREAWRKNMATKYATIGNIDSNDSLDDLSELTFGDFLDKHAIRIKLFIIFFKQFLEQNEENQAFNKEKIKSALRKIKNTSTAPNMTTFRKYHLVTSDNDIISNDIYTTTKQMSNTVIVQHPKEISDENYLVNAANIQIPTFRTAPVYWPDKETFEETGLSFSPGLSKDIKKLKIVSEMNVNSPDKAAMVGFSVLANEMRPMYRGSLTILGKHIKPWDVIHIKDSYTQMEGPVDVERVTHHFSPSHGWTTIIQPHLVCHPNPGSMILDIAESQAAYNFVTDAIDTGFNTFLIASFFTGGLGLGIRGSLGLLGRGIKGITTLSTRLLGANFKARNSKFAARAGIRTLKKALSPGFGITSSKAIRGLDSLRNSGSRWFAGVVGAWTLKSAAQAIGKGVHDWSLSQNLITSYNEDGFAKVAPVVFTPLMLHGKPFTAGVDTSERLYSTIGWDNHISYQRINEAKIRAIEYSDIIPLQGGTISEEVR